ncbi:ANTAR domain-containing protein [Phycicoccus sp. MAQZ13P-2]|uniref:ANTAR domain-containing protein n=1 Tax=Phycicoccus mangrovi TaxID=2840470 RepID=UPI001C000EC6|nr:ANTAR domain-containing protein [Phycicoccus mangrovi]MBT9254621.1 ANTAR domain-containing protein [Phycicoccus mangrovi]MBT9273174.1 ANTAR domain-containing protein [Phycicoccus mangrovi]
MVDVGCRVVSDAVDSRRPWLPQVAVDPELIIRGCNRAFSQAIGWPTSDLLGCPVAHVVGDRPREVVADGGPQLLASLERVLDGGKAHHMTIQRHDLPASGRHGELIRKYWMPINRPILDHGRVCGVLHEVRDVTYLDRSVITLLERLRDLRQSEGDLGVDGTPVVVAVTELVDHAVRLGAEADHLRRALTSRATIDQARGVVMAVQGCDPQQAFGVLRKLSNDHNVRLADLAAAIVRNVDVVGESMGATDASAGACPRATRP